MAAPHDTNMSHKIHITGERATAPLLHSQVRSLLVLEGATGEVGRATDGERIYCATRVADDDDDGADKNYLIFLQVCGNNDDEEVVGVHWMRGGEGQLDRRPSSDRRRRATD